MSARLHHKTPTLNAVDSRGLAVRQVAYWRRSADDSPQARISRQSHDVAARQMRQWDPRQLEHSPNTPLTTVYSLSGKPLRVDSVDAGWRLNLPGDAGQILRNWDQRGGHWVTTFDAQLRPVSIQETSAQQPSRITERFRYGDHSPACAALNQCGALIRHDDDAGSLLISEYSVDNRPVRQTRRFLAGSAPPDWSEEEAQRDLLLEQGKGYTTQWHYDACAAVIRQIDASQHQQSFVFDVAGQLNAVSLKLQGEAVDKPLARDFVYNAAGQIESQTAGNGVISSAAFDPGSGRLLSLTASVAGSTLQALHYRYDAVGNVTHIEDKAQPDQFASNQKVQAISTYSYDSLYQLIGATGREAQSPANQPHLPALGRAPIDAGQLFNFTQHYDYDTGGNLTGLRHVRDRNQYTRTVNIASTSNRMLSWNQGHSSADIAASFDANGNQQALHPGQRLHWNPRNRLSGVVLVARDDGRDDSERYDYDSNGQRLRKVQTTYSSTMTHRRETRYVPGLEIHSRHRERLEVISVNIGRGSVRCLHWTEGQPSGIQPDQLRYSLEDHLGSSSLELDDQAWLISQESYFPYGGTAWSASRSAVEASYRTVRYSGKERDASGLYYYGQRYYAPWLQRWISADPAGAVDGLNLYCMVSNNPMRFIDAQGLNRQDPLDYLDLAQPRVPSSVGHTAGTSRDELIDSARRKIPIVKKQYQSFTMETSRIIREAEANKNKSFNQLQALEHSKTWSYPAPVRFADPAYTSRLLDKKTAFSGIADQHHEHPLTGFHNLPGSLSSDNTFPGIRLNDSVAGKEDTYRISNIRKFMKGVRGAYSLADTALHYFLARRIRRHVTRHPAIPVSAGVAGLHAEVVAANVWLQGGIRVRRHHQRLSQAFIYTARTQKRGRGSDFPACFNCSGILPPFINIVTGRKGQSS